MTKKRRKNGGVGGVGTSEYVKRALAQDRVGTKGKWVKGRFVEALFIQQTPGGETYQLSIEEKLRTTPLGNRRISGYKWVVEGTNRHLGEMAEHHEWGLLEPLYTSGGKVYLRGWKTLAKGEVTLREIHEQYPVMPVAWSFAEAHDFRVAEALREAKKQALEAMDNIDEKLHKHSTAYGAKAGSARVQMKKNPIQNELLTSVLLGGALYWLKNKK